MMTPIFASTSSRKKVLSFSLKSSARVQKQSYEPVFPANALNFVLQPGSGQPLTWTRQKLSQLVHSASPMATEFSTHSQDASRERSTYVRRKEAEDVALAIRLSMWRHLRDINREAKARNSSALICHFLAGSLTTIVAILLHLGRL